MRRFRRDFGGSAVCLCIVVGAALLVVGMAGAKAPAGTPPLLGLARGKLVTLDPRTLKPLLSPRPLSVGPLVPQLDPVLSPDGKRVAFPGSRSLLVIDRTRLRIVRRIADHAYLTIDPSVSYFAWVGKSFVFVGEGKFGLALFFVASQGDTLGDQDIGGSETRTPEGVVVLAPGIDGRSVVLPFTGEDEDEIRIDGIYTTAPTAVAVDARRNRAFFISTTGRIAVVNLSTGGVKEHAVNLPTEIKLSDYSYQAAWAGQNHLALWGSGGLTIIDASDWSARLIDPTVTDAHIGLNAVVTSNRNAHSGITVYRPDGTLRFRALRNLLARNIGVTARFAYISDGRQRYSINLLTGFVTGPLASRATPILPDLLNLP